MKITVAKIEYESKSAKGLDECMECDLYEECNNSRMVVELCSIVLCRGDCWKKIEEAE